MAMARTAGTSPNGPQHFPDRRPGMRARALKLWNRIREPRVVSTLRFCMYLAMLLGAITALISPPRSIEGAVGELAMTGLATLLAFGGVLGAIAALPGIWWLERTAILAV